MATKRLFVCLGVFLLGGILSLRGQNGPVTYQVQLIRGTNHEKPEHADWRPVGPRLSQQLIPVFRWAHYWEVKRAVAIVQKERKTRLRLDPERELEIELVKPAVLELRLFRKGELARKSRESADARIAIMGGDTQTGESWFVVVRPDRPKST